MNCYIQHFHIAHFMFSSNGVKHRRCNSQKILSFAGCNSQISSSLFIVPLGEVNGWEGNLYWVWSYSLVATGNDLVLHNPSQCSDTLAAHFNSLFHWRDPGVWRRLFDTILSCRPSTKSCLFSLAARPAGLSGRPLVVFKGHKEVQKNGKSRRRSHRNLDSTMYYFRYMFLFYSRLYAHQYQCRSLLLRTQLLVTELWWNV